MFYVYRCTTQQLEDHLNRIHDSGDKVVWPVYTGGRDWLLICQKADPRIIHRDKDLSAWTVSDTKAGA